MTLRFQIAKGAVRAVLAIAGLVLPATSAFAHHIEKRFAVESRPVVIVRNPGGHIELKSWKNLEVMIAGDHDSDKVEVDAWKMGNRIEVVTRIVNQDAKPIDLQANYTITVPEEVELQIRSDAGSVTVAGVLGDMRVDTVTADVQLQEVGGSQVVKTIGGSVVCMRCSGRMEVNSISGSAKFVESQLGSILVQTSTGNIYFEGSFLRQGVYSFKNYSGLIDIRFSGTDSFDLSAASLYGSVENQANLKPHTHGRRESPPESAKSLVGTLNEGHARVMLSSFNGTIKIRKRE
jgi:DUF4097 and DUF4098 domain-containing protein YvlB